MPSSMTRSGKSPPLLIWPNSNLGPRAMGVIVRLLFGVMLEKKGRSRAADRRAAVLGMLGGCTDEELGMFVELLLRPMGSSSSVYRDRVIAFARCPRLLRKSRRVGRCGEEPWTAAPSVSACALEHHRPDKRSLSIPEDVDALGDVEEGRLSFKRPRMPTSLPICQCSIVLHICGDLSTIHLLSA